MKNKALAVMIAAACTVSLFSHVNSYARHEEREHPGRHEQKYYRHPRHYPSDFYFYKRVYFYPQRRYYFYYDLYPEQVSYYEVEKDTPAVNSNYLPITSIANMASQGLPDAVIIDEIKKTNSVYKLNSEIITYLKQNGASDQLIDFMLETSKSK